MKFLLIPDKFKGSISAQGVISALSNGIKLACPNAHIFSLKASDGGDGFLEALSSDTALKTIMVETVDPLGRPLQAPYLIDPNTQTAYIELASASGLATLKKTEHDCINTSTLGTGIQLKSAINKGAKNIYIGLGGSATNDAGLGIAKALGFDFLDTMGRDLSPTGKNLSLIRHIEMPKVIENISYYAVNDVNNPLFGKRGAAQVYAKQKGASAEEILLLDEGLRQIHKIIRKQLGKDYAHLPGSGSAGGAAYGLKSFFNAEFISGMDFIIKKAKITELIEKEHIDCLVTGEGRIDEQTLQGKVINGILKLGNQFNIPVIAICGTVELDKRKQKASGLYAVLEIKAKNRSLEYSIDNASNLIENKIQEYLQMNPTFLNTKK